MNCRCQFGEKVMHQVRICILLKGFSLVILLWIKLIQDYSVFIEKF